MHNHTLIQNIFSGGVWIQRQTRGGSTNFTIVKTRILENRGEGNIFSGGMGIQRQTKGGSTNFTIVKTRILENRGEGTLPKRHV